MLLGTEVGLGPGDIVLDGDPTPFKGAQHSQLFGPGILWPNRWTDQDATWYAPQVQVAQVRAFVLDCCGRYKCM